MTDSSDWVCGVCGAGDFEEHQKGCSNDPSQKVQPHVVAHLNGETLDPSIAPDKFSPRSFDKGLLEAVKIIGWSIALNGGNARTIMAACIQTIQDPEIKAEAIREISDLPP
jgi:hypothetical protein